VRSEIAAKLNAALHSQAAQATLVLALALALRLAWALITRWHPMAADDAYFYDVTARALANGRGYIQPTGDPTANWPPGYPVVLATAYVLFGEKVIVAQLLNVALGTATVWLVYLIGRRLFGHWEALLGAGIVACFPSLILYTGVTLSEITFTFLALLAIYLLIVEAQSGRPRDLRLLLGAGLVLGLAALTRGQALLLPLVLVPFWFRSGIPWRPIAHKLVVLALAMGCVLAPWTVRNLVQLHAPVLISTNAGVDFWIGHHESATGNFDYSVEFGLALEVALSHPELDGAAREVRINNDGFRKGLAFAATHPAQELILPFKKFFWLYYSDIDGVRWNEGRGLQNFLPGLIREGLLALSDVYYFAVAGLVVIGVRRWFSLRDPGRLLLISLVAYWTFIHLVFFGSPRFHAPIMPIVALLAGLAWAGTIRRRLERAD
jgi:4-amino-4-deoxy-L-arabinose transferase-like glycosyltransferase